jgi:hypothetical protein
MPPRRKPAPLPTAAEINMMRRFLQPKPTPTPAPLKKDMTPTAAEAKMLSPFIRFDSASRSVPPPVPRTPSGLLPASAFILTADTNRPEAETARIQTAFTDLSVKEAPETTGPIGAPALTTKYRPGVAARVEHMRLALTPGYRERDVYHRSPDVDERTSLYMRIKMLSLFPNIYAN